MEFTKEDLANLSSLARITVKPEEEEKMLHDMQAILGYVSEINSVSGDVGRIKSAHYNIVRDDIVTHDAGVNTAAIMAETPEAEDGYVRVSQVLK